MRVPVSYCYTLKILNYNMKIFYFLSLFILTTFSLAAQNEGRLQTATFKVSGVCGLCKQRIEAAVLGKGVSTADWKIATQLLTITYNPKRTTLEQVHQRIANVGHDTELKKAPDDVYKALHECCLYREQEVVDAHKVEVTEMEEKDSTTEETLAVNGIVLEEDRKGNFKPLVGASIFWLGTHIGVLTDSAGFFTLQPEEGFNKMVVSHTGYSPDTIEVQGGQHLKIVMVNGRQLNEVKVVASRASVYINSYDPIRKAVITQKELLKAACCNLSESFETNPSVDVSFNDAVTGSKQIQLLGLSGNYTQLTVENLPGPRGLATPLGLNTVPGTWVESIQLIKGTGSVINGFESIAGQINVELKKPETSEQLYANIYTNDFGKTDLNLNLAKQINDRWSTALLLHDAFGNKKVDMNRDGFRDLPTGNLFSGMNRWSYTDGQGWSAQAGVKIMRDEKTGGEMAFDPATHKFTNQHYGLGIDIGREEVFAKVGYVFPQKKFQSMGLQLSAFNHRQTSYFGLTTYNGRQRNVYGNFIYQSIIDNSAHKFKTGLSFLYDQYNEYLNADHYRRKEVVPGAFFEYTYSPSAQLDVVAGIRGDYNNIYGFFTTPRLNVRYEPMSGTTLRGSLGRGQRTANIFAENSSVLVSARSVEIRDGDASFAYGLQPEISWNKGLSLDQKIRLFNKNALLSFDFFRNDFQNQVVVDLEQEGKVQFYNLDGKSYSNSFQTELSIEPLHKLNVRLAYRYFDVKTTYGNQLLNKPFTAKHRAFANLGYEIGTWKFDYTVNYNSSKRIPSTTGKPLQYQLPQTSPDYVVMNAQVSKTVGKKYPVDIYLGGENLTNFFQQQAVLAADQPFTDAFDASLIWGPVGGRMIYGGLRFKIK